MGNVHRSGWLALVTLALLLAGCTNTVADTGAAATPTVPASGITITTDRVQYTSTERLNVTVTNHSSADIYAYDTQAGCSILSLEQLVNGQWGALQTPVARCPLGRPAMPVRVAAGATYHASIGAGYLNPNVGSFPVGTYRLALHYSPSPTLEAGGTTVYSAPFTVVNG